MIRRAKQLSAVIATSLLLAACASAPLHYYTLVAPADGAASAATAAASLPFELLPVGIPAQVDQPELVVRQGGQGMAVLGSERWISSAQAPMRSVSPAMAR